jgi:hypothetical protein
MRPCTASHGVRGLLSSTPSGPSLVDLQSFDHGAGVGGWSKADAVVAAGDALLAFGPVTPGAMTLVRLLLPGRGVTSLVSCSRRYATPCLYLLVTGPILSSFFCLQGILL